jgi:hypothetical protein
VARMGEGRSVYMVLVGRPEGKRPLGRPRRRWEDKFRWTLGRQGSVGRTGFSWLRIGCSGGLFVSTCNEPSGSLKKVGYCLIS